MPVYASHGGADGMVNIAWGRATVERLKTKGFDLSFQEHSELDHELAEEQARVVKGLSRIIRIKRGACSVELDATLTRSIVGRSPWGFEDFGNRSEGGARWLPPLRRGLLQASFAPLRPWTSIDLGEAIFAPFTGVVAASDVHRSTRGSHAYSYYGHIEA